MASPEGGDHSAPGEAFEQLVDKFMLRAVGPLSERPQAVDNYKDRSMHDRHLRRGACYPDYELSAWELDPISLRVEELKPGIRYMGSLFGPMANTKFEDWTKTQRREALRHGDVSPDIKSKLVSYMIKHNIKSIETVDKDRLGGYL